MDRPTILILAGGDPLDEAAAEALPRSDVVIAADGGLDEAERLGLAVDEVVGDLDSASAPAVERARARGVPIATHPADKDQTDLELALARAGELDPVLITVGGGGGGRLDHLLANAALLGGSRVADQIEWVTNEGRALFVRDRADVSGSAGDLITLLPVGESAEGVETSGLAWELRGERLPSGSTRGVSNRLVGRSATITLTRGVLMVILPRGRS